MVANRRTGPLPCWETPREWQLDKWHRLTDNTLRSDWLSCLGWPGGLLAHWRLLFEAAQIPHGHLKIKENYLCTGS
jgi:hypothetical protein